MKEFLYTIIFLLLANNVWAEDTTYYASLRAGLKQTELGYTAENYQYLANCCERIVVINKKEWLPLYYAAYAYINLSFIVKDADTKEKFCDKAQICIDSAMFLKNDQSEMLALQSLLYTARMAINPWLSGPLYMKKASNALDEAEKFNPNNPRVYYLRAKSTYHTPKFMGGGKKAAIPLFEKAISIYDRFSPEGPLHPNWGRADAERLLKKCKSN